MVKSPLDALCGRRVVTKKAEMPGSRGPLVKKKLLVAPLMSIFLQQFNDRRFIRDLKDIPVKVGIT